MEEDEGGLVRLIKHENGVGQSGSKLSFQVAILRNEKGIFLMSLLTLMKWHWVDVKERRISF